MTLSPSISREAKICLALWRKAERSKDDPSLPPVSIRLSTRSVALSFRTAMYRAIKPYRQDLLFDDELKSASDHFVVITSPDPASPSGALLILSSRKSLVELELQLEGLGISEDDLLLSEEVSMMEKLSALIEPAETVDADGSPSIIQPATPFYSRD